MKTSGKWWWGCLAGIAAVLLMVGVSEAADVLRTSFRVNNLSCGSCLSNIGAELQTLPGAIGMDADLGQHLVIVDHQSSLTEGEIAAAMEGIGYPAVALSTVKVPEGRVARPVAGGGCCGGPGQSGGQRWAPAQGNVVTSVFKVDNLSCTSCLVTIGGELQRLPGTIGIDADFSTGMVYVEHQPQVGGTEIADRISAAGYPANYLGSGKKSKTAALPSNNVNPATGGGARGGGQGYSGCNSRSCGATASAWRQLYQRYFVKKN